MFFEIPCGAYRSSRARNGHMTAEDAVMLFYFLWGIFFSVIRNNFCSPRFQCSKVAAAQHIAITQTRDTSGLRTALYPISHSEARQLDLTRKNPDPLCSQEATRHYCTCSTPVPPASHGRLQFRAGKRGERRIATSRLVVTQPSGSF